MKPNSIAQFERLYLASILVWVVSTVLSFNETVAQLKARSPGMSLGIEVMIGLIVVVCVIAAGIWYLIARQRSVVGKWILSIWFLISACIVSLNLFATGLGFNLVMLANLIAFGLGAWGLSYLYKPDAEQWFSKPSA